MLTNQRSSSRITLWVGLASVAIGLIIGFLAGAQPLYLSLAVGAVLIVFYFFARFEQTVIGLLILRTSLDPFSAQQIPAAFAMGLNALTLLYVVLTLLTGRTVHTDWFWWIFAGWVMLQGLWVILLPLGGLGLDASFLPDSIREWVRIFSWLIIYLLVMQLKDRIHPQKFISLMLLSLVVPVIVGLIMIPGGERVHSTIGHPNSFATYLSLMMALVWWKLNWTQPRWPWILLLGLLAVVYVSTRSLAALATIGVLILVLNASKLNPLRIISAVILLLVVIALFASTEAGQTRLLELTQTPLFNADMDVSRTMIIAAGDGNSFNWRISHWYYLLQSWQQYPIFGYGIGTGRYLSPLRNPEGTLYTPHNDYIRFLVEQGILGLVLYLAFIGAQFAYLLQILRRAPRHSSESQLCQILLAILLSTLVNMLSNNVLDIGDFWFYYWAVFPVAGWGTERFNRPAQAIQPA
ncbi:lipid A core-O-antigen ligase-like enyme [Cylindrospermum stagnale PCC 7417]|uniref:Lipid A core-O-antigen ligase-like enyme n=1 Tax=Cylindrospermum stagnale PCC 7417 TaxID=56107 RepID=K9WTB5_9NOST|nr:O-antigen ligase family protein [Cylindrospermum stagnale]AFZ22777.1 lipid A core-O-antigen ligase-like enyme [Cylindrospermum stagnale PCC 7417]